MVEQLLADLERIDIQKEQNHKGKHNVGKGIPKMRGFKLFENSGLICGSNSQRPISS